jgi:hypothetical protein
VTGSNATASDSGTGWTLIGAGSTPGQDQFQLKVSSGLNLTTSPQCDPIASGCPTNSVAPGAQMTEALALTGPSASSDAAATSFATAVTYTAF